MKNRSECSTFFELHTKFYYSFKNGFAFAFDSFDKPFKTRQKCNAECVVQGNGSPSAHFALGQLRGSLQRKKMRIYDS
jgi:predicted metal-binding protein